MRQTANDREVTPVLRIADFGGRGSRTDAQKRRPCGGRNGEGSRRQAERVLYFAERTTRLLRGWTSILEQVPRHRSYYS